ncbi:hypothetical protein CoNPh32_CDS0013 [Staphylococcus phage S-CoN_Ph32]|nr:hypothetical protein CoNPh32_CDS0013 [Staphylococcus phage S-CoN_Ph32]
MTLHKRSVFFTRYSDKYRLPYGLCFVVYLLEVLAYLYYSIKFT